MKIYLNIVLIVVLLVSCGAPPPVVKPHPRPHPNTNAPPPILQAFVLARTAAGLVKTNRYKISIEWLPSPTVTVVGYQVWLGTVSGQETNMTAVDNVTNAVISGLPVATYYVVVTAMDASGVSSAPSLELKIPRSPTVVYTPTNMVVACSLTNKPFRLYSTTNLMLSAKQWPYVLATNSVFLPWSKLSVIQLFYGLDLNSNRVPLALWTTGIYTTNYYN